jgi:hypothetical protein
MANNKKFNIKKETLKKVRDLIETTGCTSVDEFVATPAYKMYLDKPYPMLNSLERKYIDVIIRGVFSGCSNQDIIDQIRLLWRASDIHDGDEDVEQLEPASEDITIDIPDIQNEPDAPDEVLILEDKVLKSDGADVGAKLDDAISAIGDALKALGVDPASIGIDLVDIKKAIESIIMPEQEQIDSNQNDDATDTKHVDGSDSNQSDDSTQDDVNKIIDIASGIIKIVSDAGVPKMLGIDADAINKIVNGAIDTPTPTTPDAIEDIITPDFTKCTNMKNVLDVLHEARDTGYRGVVKNPFYGKPYIAPHSDSEIAAVVPSKRMIMRMENSSAKNAQAMEYLIVDDIGITKCTRDQAVLSAKRHGYVMPDKAVS